MDHGMNVMIPLGGIGSRFQKEGYIRPKPFVRVLGKEMIMWVIDSLELGPKDTLIVVYNPAFLDMKYEMELVLDAVPSAVLVELPRPTLGAAETVRFGLEALDKTARRRPCLLVDGDTFYTCDIVGMYREVSSRAGATFCFHDTQPKPIYSYVTMPRRARGDNSIEKIVEKVKISDWANTGCYCFRDGDELLEYCAKIIERGETQLSQDQKGEFYTSGVIKAMLDDGKTFEAIVLKRDDMHVLGTPEQVKEFCLGWSHPSSYRFCFDIDNTLFTSPTVPGDYATCVPIPRTVALLKALHANGHYIILNTARRMRTHAANVGAVVADVGVVTLKALEDARLPYHEIHFGKPWAQFYIDDHAVNAFADLEKELGYYLPLTVPSEPNKNTAPPRGGGSPTAKDLAQRRRSSWTSVLHTAVAVYAVTLTALLLAKKFARLR